MIQFMIGWKDYNCWSWRNSWMWWDQTWRCPCTRCLCSTCHKRTFVWEANWSRNLPLSSHLKLLHFQRLTTFKEPSHSQETVNPDVEKRNRIIKRAACEFQDGMYANLGIGMPMLASNYIPQGMNITLQSENGVLGLVRDQIISIPFIIFIFDQ